MTPETDHSKMEDVFKIQQLMAKYTRSADYRDGLAASELFLEDAAVEIIYDKGGSPITLGVLNGRAMIAAAMSTMMKPHPALAWGHHTMHDPLIEIDGDDATMDAQFITFDVVGFERPEEGWPRTAFGAQGVIKAIESGYYRSTLRKVANRWYFNVFQILHDLPYAIPD